MWSRSERRASRAAPGEDAVPVAEDDELAHPRRRVVLVDGVRPVEVEHREDPCLRVLQPGADEIHGGGAELLHLPGHLLATGAYSEVGEGDVDVEVRLHGWSRQGCCVGRAVEEVESTLSAGDDTEGPGFAGLEVVGLSESTELLRHLADEPVERGEVLGVAGRFEPGGAREVTRARVTQRDVVPGASGLFLLGLLLGREPGGSESDQPLDGRDPEAVDAGGELLVDPAGCLVGQGVGGLGDLAGLVGRHFEGLDLGAQEREPVPEVEGVGHQAHRRLGRDTHRGTELLRHERRHRRGPVATQGGITVRQPGESRVAPGRRT